MVVNPESVFSGGYFKVGSLSPCPDASWRHDPCMKTERC